MFGDELKMEIHKENEEFCLCRGEFFQQESAFFRQCREIALPFGEIHSRESLDNAATTRYQHSKKLLRGYFFIAAFTILIVYSIDLLGEDWLPYGNGMAPWDRIVYSEYQPQCYVERVYYTVKAGDTLWDIAKKYMGNGLGYHEIVRENKLKNPDLIFPGDKLIIPIVHIEDD